MFKRIIVIICFSFLNLIIFSENISDNKNKSNFGIFDFTIGGNLETSYSFNISRSFINPSVQLSIPVSIIFYQNKIFNFGLSYHLGYRFTFTYSHLEPTIFNLSNDFINKFLLVNKIGDIKNKSLLLEYGIIVIGRYNYQINNDKSSLNYNYDDNLYSKPRKSLGSEFIFGPSIFIGYENKMVHNFFYTIGGLFDFTTKFAYSNYDNNTTFWYVEMNLTVGIGIRLGYYYIKEN
jgi:hypothetical protein